MSRNIKTNTGEKTNVKYSFINNDALDTPGRDDDFECWDSMEYFGKSDEKEAEYESPDKVSGEVERKITSLRARLFGARFKDIYNAKTA